MVGRDYTGAPWSRHARGMNPTPTHTLTHHTVAMQLGLPPHPTRPSPTLSYQTIIIYFADLQTVERAKLNNRTNFSEQW